MSPAEKRIARLIELVRNRLKRGANWAKVQKALVTEGLADSLNRELTKIERERIDAAQMALPGFEALPKRIGNDAIGDVTVKKIFAFKAAYEKRSERDAQTLDQLKTLTQKLKRFEYAHPNIAVAEALRRLDALAVMTVG